jgi:hypothetical protein
MQTIDTDLFVFMKTFIDVHTMGFKVLSKNDYYTVIDLFKNPKDAIMRVWKRKKR